MLHVRLLGCYQQASSNSLSIDLHASNPNFVRFSMIFCKKCTFFLHKQVGEKSMISDKIDRQTLAARNLFENVVFLEVKFGAESISDS